MNLKKLRESRVKTGHHGPPLQSVSAGGVVEDSILDSRAGISMNSQNNFDDFSSDEDAILLSEAPKHKRRPRNGSYSIPIKSASGQQIRSAAGEEDNGDYDVLLAHQSTSPTRMSSNPIQIENSGRPHLRDSGHIPFPLTDGALAEYSALSSTPLSNSSVSY